MAIGNNPLIAAVMITLLSCSSSRADQSNAPAAKVNQDQPAGDSSSPPAQAGSASPTGADAWRYKRHDGLWWYWLPSNSWVYWTDGKWVAYDQKTYAEFQASRRVQPRSSQPARSYSGDGSWGQWGPKRYDRFGNPQYPYSQRSRGMQQLGPVPTPAGVRSLPGWGGER